MKVMILAASYKKQFLEEMIKYFPKEIKTKVLDLNVCQRDCRIPFIPSGVGWKKMLEFKPDIIYTDHITYTGWYTDFLRKNSERRWMAALIKKSGSINTKLVYRIRGHWFKEYFRNLTLSPKHALSFPVIYPITLFSFKACDAFVPICNWLDKDLVAKRYPSKPSFVLPQGINPGLFYKDKDNLKMINKKPSVGILQSFEIWDKVQGMIDFTQVIKEMPHVHFYVCGGGYHKKKVTKALRVCDNVTFLGKLKYPDDVRKFYNSIDVFVLPSGLDCCPTTILEAGLCEKPVCASNVGGIPEIVNNDKTGYLINNNFEWESKIQLLIDDKNKAAQMGKNARKFVVNNYSWQVLAPRLGSFLLGLSK